MNSVNTYSIKSFAQLKKYVKSIFKLLGFFASYSLLHLDVPMMHKNEEKSCSLCDRTFILSEDRGFNSWKSVAFTVFSSSLLRRETYIS